MSRLTTIEDLLRFAAPSEPRLSPDGSSVAFVVKTVNATKNRYETRLYLAPADGSAPPRVFTQGESVSNHRWAPDSQSLVFVRADEKKSQLWQLSLSGGEAIKISDLPQGSIGELAFSPDGTKLLFSFRPADEAFSESAVEARKKANQSTPPHVITRLRWRNEGAGWSPSAFFDLHTLTLATGEVTKLTDGERDYGSYCWSPCGKFIAYTQNTAPNPDLQMGATALFVWEPGGGAPCEIGTLGPKGNLAWSPDGKHIAFLGHDHADEVWGTWNVHPWVVEVESGAARDLTPGWDVTAGDNALGEVYGRGDNGPFWDGESVVFVASDQGEVGIYKVGLDGGAPEKLTPEGRSEAGVSLASGKMATLRLTSHDAGDVYVEGKRLSETNAALCSEVSFIEPKSFSVGEVPCFALIPEGDGPHPTILYIHGGPHLMYGRWHLFHEYQALAAAGFAVIYPNPRGSRGYGEAWTGAIKDNWGAPAMDDCMACVDYAIAQGWSDPSRLAVMGGSYGGYLTAWIVGHTDRFACAIAERGAFRVSQPRVQMRDP